MHRKILRGNRGRLMTSAAALAHARAAFFCPLAPGTARAARQYHCPPGTPCLIVLPACLPYKSFALTAPLPPGLIPPGVAEAMTHFLGCSTTT